MKYAVLVVVLLSIIGVLLLPRFISKESSTSMPTVTLSPSLKPVPNDDPVINSPQANSKVASPITIKGTVPPGWMFEGQLKIIILDKERNIIAQAPAKETIPGSWMSGNRADFQGTISFQTIEDEGYVVIQNDNPSGLPENSKQFEIPIKFQK